MKFQITFTIILVLLSRIVQIEMRETLYDKLYENNLK
jgi:hypothetical protein